MTTSTRSTDASRSRSPCADCRIRARSCSPKRRPGGSMLFPWIFVALPPIVGPSTPPQSSPTPLLALYQELHAHPELSYAEEATSKRIADELRQCGFEVTEHVG